MQTTIDISKYTNGFIVTGLKYNSTSRFRRTYSQANAHWAFGINLWRGHVWGVDAQGKRHMLKSVYN